MYSASSSVPDEKNEIPLALQISDIFSHCGRGE
jgi:hypothetical protein